MGAASLMGGARYGRVRDSEVLDRRASVHHRDALGGRASETNGRYRNIVGTHLQVRYLVEAVAVGDGV